MKIIIALLVLLALIESKAYGRFVRPSTQVFVSETQTSSATPPPSATPEMGHSEPDAFCKIDWTLAVSYENQRAILSCYRALYSMSGPPLCPPAFSEWEAVFNSSVCWAINHGTPAALTATAQPPTPTLWPPDTLTPAPPAYP